MIWLHYYLKMNNDDKCYHFKCIMALNCNQTHQNFLSFMIIDVYHCFAYEKNRWVQRELYGFHRWESPILKYTILCGPLKQNNKECFEHTIFPIKVPIKIFLATNMTKRKGRLIYKCILRPSINVDTRIPLRILGYLTQTS